MSNSSLVTYTNLTKNHSGKRNHAIDTITIHCIVGQWTAKQGCDYFATTDRECSANYVVGKDGSIGLSVEEANRSWCSSSRTNDHRAITIEVASDTKHPYAVTNAAYEALIKLCADICKRNGIKKLVWSTVKNDRVNHLNGCNMTVHRDFDNKSCPGQYLYDRHGDIAERVNKLLGVASAAGEPAEPVPSAPAPSTETPTIKVGDVVNFTGSKHYVSANASTGPACKPGKAKVTAIYQLGNSKHPYHLVRVSGGGSTVYGWVDAADIAGASTSASTPAKPVATIKKGSTVRLNKGAKTYTGKALASFVYNRNHKVKEISGDRVVITFGGIVVAAVKLSDLTLIS